MEFDDSESESWSSLNAQSRARDGKWQKHNRPYAGLPRERLLHSDEHYVV